MTDDELRQYLKPRHNWTAIIGAALALLGAAAALGRWAFTAPTQTDYQAHENRIKAVEVTTAVVGSKVDGLRDDLVNQKQDIHEIKVDLRALLERRR